MRTTKLLAAAAFALLFAAACGSSGIGDILGTNQSYDITGRVDSVDLNSRSIYLTNVTGYSNNLNTGGNAVRVYYDDRTTVEYQGRTYRPQDLERGDEVRVRANQSGGTLVAESMTVTYNARGGMTSSSTIPSGSTIHGTVRSIDTRNRTLALDRGFGSNLVISYNSSTPVYYNNRTYSITQLEVADEVDIRTSNLGGSSLGAQDITVTRSISAGGTASSSNLSTLRGTVRSVDTYNRTITLDSTSWMSGFRSSTS